MAPEPTNLTPAQHRKRALQAAKLRKSKLPWQAIADHLGYSSANAASRAVRRHTNPQHPNAVKATRDNQPPEPDNAGRDRALQAGALRTVGLDWNQIANQLGYPSAAAARQAWARHRHHLPPPEYHATRGDRWENLYRRNMSMLADTLADDEPDLMAARSHIAIGQNLLATQPQPNYQTADVAGRVMAEYHANGN